MGISTPLFWNEPSQHVDGSVYLGAIVERWWVVEITDDWNTERSHSNIATGGNKQGLTRMER